MVPACGGDDDGGGGGDGDGAADGAPESAADGAPGDEADAAPSSFVAHLIRPACAPNDGAAVRVLLGDPVGGTG